MVDIISQNSSDLAQQAGRLLEWLTRFLLTAIPPSPEEAILDISGDVNALLWHRSELENILQKTPTALTPDQKQHLADLDKQIRRSALLIVGAEKGELRRFREGHYDRSHWWWFLDDMLQEELIGQNQVGAKREHRFGETSGNLLKNAESGVGSNHENTTINLDDKQFSLEHLSASEFEQFCFELLVDLGFKNLNWRKGTGFTTSPSDQGRDIECEYPAEDPDGNPYIERWFVECKHHKHGVSPEKLQSILSWASAERPDKILIIISNFLSNPAKSYLKNYQKENKPAFKIRVWERPDIERITAGRSRLLIKYKIIGDYPHSSLMHPAHIQYIKSIRPNSLNYFLKLLDSLRPQKRESMLQFAFLGVIDCEIGEPVTGLETFNELLINKVDYYTFRKKCLNLTQVVAESFIVSSIVNCTLQYLLKFGDKTQIDKIMANYDSTIEHAQKLIEENKGDLEQNKRIVKTMVELKKNCPDQINKNYELYLEFCECIVKELFLEDIRY